MSEVALFDLAEYDNKNSKPVKRDPDCTLCPLHKTAQHVCLLGQGPKNSEVMIIGEAPGQREDDSGKPFVGKSGQLLIKVLNEYGFKREDIYITNAVSCRPPDNRTPKKGEIKACRTWLFKQMGSVKPKFVMLLGAVAIESALGLKGIKKLRGKPIEKDGIVYFPTYHPSFVLRDPANLSVFESDVRIFKDIVETGGIPTEDDLNLQLVDSPKQFKRMLKDLSGTVSSDIETTCLYPWDKIAKINSVGFGTRNAQWILLFNHEGHGYTNKDFERQVGMTPQEAMDEIDEVLQDCVLVGQNWKFDSLWLRVHYGVKWAADFDTMLAHFLLDENSFHGLKHLSQKYYGAFDYDVDTKTKLGQGKLAPFLEYQALDLLYTRKLYFTLGKLLDKEPEVKQVFEKIMMPCSRIFMDMEHRGFYVNIKQMDEVEKKLRTDLADAEKKLKKYGDINWGSPVQLAKLLFEDLGLDIIEKTAAGKPSTSESVLKRIDHPMVTDLLKFRAAKQQLSFFIDGWKPFLDGNRIHPSFKLHGTVTGRLSCEHPNLQQVPRDPAIRSLIGAPEGWTLLEVDLSQIELRIAAELANERAMLEAFKNGVDVHWLTAIREIARGRGMVKEVLGTAAKYVNKKPNELKYDEAIKLLLKMGPDKAVEIDESWKELRKKAKAINFGYLYGMWWKKFKIYARDNYGVVVTDQQAQDSREAYFELYSDLDDWHKKQRMFARRHGYVSTLSGRKRRLPAATSHIDSPERGAAERQAINSPVQSFANELNLMTLIQIDREFSKKHVRPVGTVHDACLIEVRNDRVRAVTERVLEIMRKPDLLEDFGIELKVPVEADAKIGPWGKGVSLEKYLKGAAR